jgi:hypothetical protein
VLDGDRIVGTYDRGYRMLQTFDPFRRGAHDYALISPRYTGTSVMDLSSGEIVVSEEESSGGFCPAGFYVPDWWDVHDGITLPGSHHWTGDHEWPSDGSFGFVWGCIWGDDSSWKVQYLDLSGVQDGRLQRDDRFGYLKLATYPALAPNELIRVESLRGTRKVEFSLRHRYDLATGHDAEENPFGGA